MAINTAYSAIISNQGLIYAGKEDVRKVETYGWSVVLIPKGIDFDPLLEDEYEYDPIHSENDLQILIAATKQDNGVICVNKEGKTLVPEEVFAMYFPNHIYKSWDDYHCNNKLNCNPLIS